MLASDIMTRRVITTTAHATIEDAALSMLQHRVSGLPVITAEGTIVGVVSEGDLLRRAFSGSAKALLLGALSSRKASQQDLEELRQIIDEYEAGKS